MIELGTLSDNERTFYTEKILEAIERAEETS